MPALEKTEYTLYGGQVKLTFNPNASGRTPRYTVVDAKGSGREMPVRGVTTVLRDILDKPDLMRWPMNMSHSKLFGAKFDEVLLDYTHDWKNAVIQPETAYSEEQLHEAMNAGARAHTERQDRGKDVGTLAHSVVERILARQDYALASVLAENEVNEEDTKALTKIEKTFQKWWNAMLDRDPETQVIFSEKPLYSRRLNYCGTMDMCIIHAGKTYLLDFKTTNRSRAAALGIYPDYFLQLGAYSYAMNEETGTRANDLGIVNVNKDGQLSVMTAKDMGFDVDECERAFAFAIRLHDWLEVAKKSLKENAKVNSILNPLTEVG